MTASRLTARIALARRAGMARSERHDWWATATGLAVMVGAAALSSCVSVTAPDKPIVIELNINIKQEVIYRLAADASATIESNPGIF